MISIDAKVALLVIHFTTFAASELIETEDKHVYASDLN
jgi:hypothetical protein